MVLGSWFLDCPLQTWIRLRKVDQHSLKFLHAWCKVNATKSAADLNSTVTFLVQFAVVCTSTKIWSLSLGQYSLTDIVPVCKSIISLLQCQRERERVNAFNAEKQASRGAFLVFRNFQMREMTSGGSSLIHTIHPRCGLCDYCIVVGSQLVNLGSGDRLCSNSAIYKFTKNQNQIVDLYIPTAWFTIRQTVA